MSTTTATVERSELTLEHVRAQVRIIRGLTRNGSYPPPAADVIEAGRIAAELDEAFGSMVETAEVPPRFNPLLAAMDALGQAVAAHPNAGDTFAWSATYVAEMLAELVGLED